MNRKKLFVIGIGSLTGYKLANLAKNQFEIWGSYNLRNPMLDFVESVKLDITNYEKVEEIFLDFRPDCVINTAALTNVDYCEFHQAEANKTNIEAVRNLAKVSNTINAKFVHISSDSVFDGIKKGPYNEGDFPNPINYYGFTKLEGEKIVLQNKKNLIVRASVLYGWMPEFLSTASSSSMKPNNFALWLIKQLMKGEKVKIITDEYSSPIIADDFAKSIIHLVLKNSSGVFHSAPSIEITRYEFSVKIAKFLELDVSLIKPTNRSELGRQVTTASNKCLDSKKITSETGFQFLSLEQSLELIKRQMAEDV